MEKDIEVGDYLLSLHAVSKAEDAAAPDGTDTPAPPERYAVRVRVTRLAVHGSTIAGDSGEMTGDHGQFETVAEAIAHGEAWALRRARAGTHSVIMPCHACMRHRNGGVLPREARVRAHSG